MKAPTVGEAYDKLNKQLEGVKLVPNPNPCGPGHPCDFCAKRYKKA